MTFYINIFFLCSFSVSFSFCHYLALSRGNSLVPMCFITLIVYTLSYLPVCSLRAYAFYLVCCRRFSQQSLWTPTIAYICLCLYGAKLNVKRYTHSIDWHNEQFYITFHLSNIDLFFTFNRWSHSFVVHTKTKEHTKKMQRIQSNTHRIHHWFGGSLMIWEENRSFVIVHSCCVISLSFASFSFITSFASDRQNKMNTIQFNSELTFI